MHEFVVRLRDRIEQMEEAAAGGDAERLGQLAHWLKGSGGTAGFPPLSDAARDLEQAIKTSDSAAIALALVAISELTDRIELPELAVAQS